MIGVLLLLSSLAFATVDPSSITIKLYSLAVSENADCTNPLVVADSVAGISFDVFSGPTMASGFVPNGTYPCVIVTISDQLSFITVVGEGSCVAGTSYTLDLCLLGASTSPLQVARVGQRGSYGADVPCVTSTTEDRVTLYMSTASSCQTNCANPFLRPTVVTNGVALAPALTMSRSSGRTFVINGMNKVDGSGGTCTMLTPTFGFR